MPRVFIGVDVPMLAPLRRLIEELSHIGPSVRPVRTDGLHLTLRFLGDVEPSATTQLAEALDAAVGEGREAGWLMPFDLHLTRLDAFPHHNSRHPRVVFAASDDPGPLPRLSELIDAKLDASDLDITPRDHPMHAHVTLARVKHRRRPDRRAVAGIADLFKQTQGTSLGTARIKAVKLIESRLGAQGPDYKALHVSTFK